MSFIGLLFTFVTLLLFWKVVFPFLHIIFKYTLGKKLYSKRKQLRTAGEWAIVTGATDGIGKAYARQLAKDGLKIMLISRTQEKLNRVAEEIQKEFHVETKTVACDFTRTDIYEMLQQEIDKLPSIACLVNNVAVSYPYLASFSDACFIDLDFIRNMINCNVTSMASLTRIVLPRLLKQPDNGSAIINLGSFCGLITIPYLSVYGATKAFTKQFVQSLFEEVKDSKVYVQAVCPLFVATKMSKIERPSFFAPSPDTFAASALDMLGVEPVTLGCLPHALQGFIYSIHPSVAPWVARNLLKNSTNHKRQ